jgi:hypothetical protein
MRPSSRIDSRSPCLAGGTTTRAQPHDDTAEPALTSGFGGILEQVEDLQASTDGNIGLVNGPHAHAINRMLRNHHLRLSHNIALLEQRYERGPPSALSVRARQGRIDWGIKSARTAPPASIEQLPELVAQHVRVIASIQTLLAGSGDGQRGELILAELARNHEQMVTMLATLIREDETVRDAELLPILATSATTDGRGP